jgi:hypothetical protein
MTSLAYRFRRRQDNVPVLGLTQADWQHVLATREDRDEPQRELTGHAVLMGAARALCDVAVVEATPTTPFGNPLLSERWGPIRQCEWCARNLGLQSPPEGSL